MSAAFCQEIDRTGGTICDEQIMDCSCSWCVAPDRHGGAGTDPGARIEGVEVRPYHDPHVGRWVGRDVLEGVRRCAQAWRVGGQVGELPPGARSTTTTVRRARGTNTPKLAPGRTVRTTASPELIEQRLRLSQVRRVKALGEPTVGPGEQVEPFSSSTLRRPQPREARGAA